MFDLKPLSKDGISEALEKAMRYRLLNEPREAESICLDIMEIDPDNQRALVTLLLALTDQFNKGTANLLARTRELLPRLQGEYHRVYYRGIIAERQAKAVLDREYPGCEFDAYEHFRDAMDLYDQAERIRPSGNDDPILRWNACARMINQRHLEPRAEKPFEPFLE